ncbi:putative peptidase [Synechococcus sp. BIOS-U3-1]|nr:putative peptidase [Synechococcus sp. BIOS-U3-1]
MVFVGMKRSTLSIFLAGAAALSSQIAVPAAFADTNPDTAPMGGGLQEWNTDQDIDAKAKKDADAKKAAEKAAEEDICVPIGEGENCW